MGVIGRGCSTCSAQPFGVLMSSLGNSRMQYGSDRSCLGAAGWEHRTPQIDVQLMFGCFWLILLVLTLNSTFKVEVNKATVGVVCIHNSQIPYPVCYYFTILW